MMNVLLMANWGIGREVLVALLDSSQVTIDRVITNYDRNSKSIWRNAVADLAKQNDICVDHGQAWSTSELATYLNSEIDLLITHAWPKILPAPVFEAPHMGSMNIHPSLLPKYRGPAPHDHVLINRDPDTGLTSHFIDAGIDTGPVISRMSVSLHGNETIEQLIEVQKPLVRPLMCKSLGRLSDPAFKPEVQDESLATYAPKLRK